MAKWMPCKRRDFIKKLKKLGFEPPEPGGHHHRKRTKDTLKSKDLGLIALSSTQHQSFDHGKIKNNQYE